MGARGPAEGATQRPPIGPKDTVRDILTRYPEAEEVFDRHGLGGCGGPQGPMEPIGFFAVVHHVDPDALLQELNEVVARLDTDNQRPGPSTSRLATAAETSPIYAPFITASLLLAVGAGFAMGLWAMLTMTQGVGTGPFSWIALVQVHGQVQAWGFVGLFIMGVAYHAVPRFRGTALGEHARRLSLWSLLLVAAGVLLRAAQLGLPQPWAYPTALLGAIFTLLGACVFALVIARVLVRGAAWEGHERFLVAGLAWLVLAAGSQVGLMAWLWRTGNAFVPPHLGEPYLTALLFGFVLTSILGVSVRTLPVFLGLRQGHPTAILAAFWLVTAGTASLAVGQALEGAEAPLQWLVAAGALMVLAGVVSFIGGLRLLEPREMAVPDLSRQGVPSDYRGFIRTAYAWLLAATAISAYLGLRWAVGGPAASMTDTSAARHALALGFITLMIVGMTTRILPVFTGNRLFSARLQRLAFWALFASAGLRAGIELARGYGTSLDWLLSASGALGTAGVVLFAANTWLTMKGWAVGQLASDDQARGPGGPIEGSTPLSAIVKEIPGAEDALAAWGLSMLQDPQHREAALRTLTLEQAARMAKVDAAPLVEALRRMAAGEQGASGNAITPVMVVADVLERYPQTLQVFIAHGFTPLANPAMRQKLASTVTVAQAAQMRGVDLRALLEALNDAAGVSTASGSPSVKVEGGT